MHLLKQSTAATVVLGPFVDSTDGATAETGLTISQADIRLSKNGAAFAQTNNATGASHMENGYYSIPLDTTDTNTVGRMTVAVSESGALQVWREFQIVEETVYDALFATSAAGELAVKLSTQGKAEVNAEMVDVLATDTYAEPGQGTPAATASLKDKIGYLYKAWRNKTEQTDSEYRLFADDGSTVHQEADVSDDTVTFTRSEVRAPS